MSRRAKARLAARRGARQAKRRVMTQRSHQEQRRVIPSGEATLVKLAECPNDTIELTEAQAARVRQIRDKAPHGHHQPA
jgi:hypothetical protein